MRCKGMKDNRMRWVCILLRSIQFLYKSLDRQHTPSPLTLSLSIACTDISPLDRTITVLFCFPSPRLSRTSILTTSTDSCISASVDWETVWFTSKPVLGIVRDVRMGSGELVVIYT